MDDPEKTREVADGLSFPVFHGVTRAQGDAIGAWWEERRDHVQPSEFIVNQRGRVLGSTYSNSPVGRMDPQETLTLIKLIKQMAQRRR